LSVGRRKTIVWVIFTDARPTRTSEMLIAGHPKQRPRSFRGIGLVVLSCTLILVLAVLASGDTRSSWGAAFSSYSATEATAAVVPIVPPQPVHQCCTWTPYMLSDNAQRWVLDASVLGVPTMVGPVRKHLSLALAIGALEQNVRMFSQPHVPALVLSVMSLMRRDCRCLEILLKQGRGEGACRLFY
jgi:hypothetical protein